MPRNVEYLLEKYVEENNLPLFILTCSIDNGFYPPEYILKQFGSGYGMDNIIFSHEELLKDKTLKEKELISLLDSKEIDTIEVQHEITKKYNNEIAEYNRWLTYYEEEMEKLNKMNARVNTLNAKSKIQEKFLKSINEYFNKRSDEITELYKERLIKPIEESFEQARNRMTTEKINELKNCIATLELRLSFDETFFKEITNEWLS